MKANALLMAAAGILVLANAMLLGHALRNRLGAADAEITLTQRELSYYGASASDQDSGVALHLVWWEPTSLPWAGPSTTPQWLDQPALERLGFDCSVAPKAPGADRHYQLERARQAYVALEYDGPAWRHWLETYQRFYDESNPTKPSHTPIEDVPNHSRLIAIDADRDPRALRARHPDRSSVLILPAIIGISYQPYTDPPLIGHVRELPTAIHVPRPFSDRFRQLDRLGYRPNMAYRVRLRYGSLYEPWVEGVEIQ